MAQTFDGPPSLERSGSEHRRAVTSSLFGQERGLVRDVEPSLMVKKDGMILEGNHLNIFRKKNLLVLKRTVKVLQYLMFRILFRKISVFRRNAPIDTERIIQYRDTPISLRVIEVITLILEYRSF